MRAVDEMRTIAGQRLLGVGLDPIVHGVDRLVIEVFPAGMLKSLQCVKSRAWQQEHPGQYTLRTFSSEDVPGHKPTIRPSSLPALYHERHFAAYTD